LKQVYTMMHSQKISNPLLASQCLSIQAFYKIVIYDFLVRYLQGERETRYVYRILAKKSRRTT